MSAEFLLDFMSSQYCFAGLKSEYLWDFEILRKTYVVFKYALSFWYHFGTTMRFPILSGPYDPAGSLIFLINSQQLLPLTNIQIIPAYQQLQTNIIKYIISTGTTLCNLQCLKVWCTPGMARQHQVHIQPETWEINLQCRFILKWCGYLSQVYQFLELLGHLLKSQFFQHMISRKISNKTFFSEVVFKGGCFIFPVPIPPTSGYITIGIGAPHLAPYPPYAGSKSYMAFANYIIISYNVGPL